MESMTYPPAPTPPGSPSPASQERIEDAVRRAHAHMTGGEPKAARRILNELLGELAADDWLRADVMRQLGTLEREAGNPTEAAEWYTASLKLARDQGHDAGVAHATNWLAVLSVHRGQFEEAERLFADARAEAESAGEDRLVGMIEQNVGVLLNIRGDLAGALERYEAALAGFRSAGDAAMQASVLNNCGTMALRLNRWDEAERCFAESLDIARSAGLPSLVNSIRLNAADLAVRRSQWELVEDAATGQAERARVTGSRLDEAQAMRLEGLAALDAGSLADAEHLLSNAARLAVEAQDHLLEARLAVEIGAVFHAARRDDEARVALHAAAALYRRMGAQPDLEYTMARIAELAPTVE